MHRPSASSSSSHRFAPLALSLLAALTGGCLGVDPPEGRLRCTPATVAVDCPSGWFCHADDERCWRAPGESVDAGMDAGAADAFVVEPDAFDFDAPGLDAPMPDAFVERDAFMADDAGPMPDVFVPPDAYSECSSPADCDDGDLCTDDDCVANLCTHDSVVCNDGFSCTLDACAPATGCTYPPNPAAPCPMGRTCDPTGTGMDGMGADAAGCIDADDCSSAAMCDDGNYCTIDSCSSGACVNAARTCTTDSNPCTLAAFCDEDMDRCNEPFDVTSLSEPTHCGTSPATCSVCPTVGPNTVATCNTGVCGVACAPGFYNLDGAMANGCEYACTFVSALDFPDAAAADANCDGADGILGSPSNVYVRTDGASTGPGDSPATAVTITRAFAVAAERATSGTRVQMLIASGTYSISSSLSVSSGSTMLGSYAADFRSRDTSMRSLVASSAPRALNINGVTTTIDAVDFSTADQSGTGNYTSTVTIVSSTNTILRNLSITGGAGGPGLAGSAGASPARAPSGSAGSNGTATSGGTGGGASGAPSSGGVGSVYGSLAGPGQASAVVMSGCGNGGSRGTGGTTACTPCDLLHSLTTANGGSGTVGCSGSAGAQGLGGSGAGSLSAGGWLPPAAGAGGNGSAGQAGGGGGGGAGVACTVTGERAAGGGGGQGGQGGGGGGGGTPGQPGGGSFAITAFASTVTLESVTLVARSGGAGGRGGDGGVGGEGGAGGMGGTGYTNALPACGGTFAEAVRGGNGAAGGNGGSGGNGGCGGGGAGGPSIPLFTSGTVVNSTGVTFTAGSGGAAGLECSGGGGNRGSTGVSMNQLML